MSEKQRLIQWLEKAREEMRAVLEIFDQQDKIYPRWRMKEVLAHIIGWDDVIQTALQAQLDGEEPFVLPSKTIDAYNAEMVNAHRSLSYEQVLRRWEDARVDLRRTLEAMPEEAFEERIVFPWGQEGKAKKMVAIIAGHEQEHAREIRDLKE